MKRKEFKDLMDQLDRINNQYSALKRLQSYSHKGEVYYPAELNTLKFLSEKPWLTVSDVSAALYISRSAASQIIKKLAAKDLIIKKRNLMNERIVNLSLTAEAELIVQESQSLELRQMEDFFQVFSEIEDDDMRIARGFLYKLEKLLKLKLN